MERRESLTGKRRDCQVSQDSLPEDPMNGIYLSVARQISTQLKREAGKSSLATKRSDPFSSCQTSLPLSASIRRYDGEKILKRIGTMAILFIQAMPKCMPICHFDSNLCSTISLERILCTSLSSFAHGNSIGHGPYKKGATMCDFFY